MAGGLLLRQLEECSIYALYTLGKLLALVYLSVYVVLADH